MSARERRDSCPLCGGGSPELFIREPATLRCAACGAYFLGEVPPGASLASEYQEEYYEEGTGARFLGVFEAFIGLCLHLRVRSILRREPGPSSILDVGCGRGDLLAAFQRRGWRALGTQLSRTAAEAARRTRAVEVLTGELAELDLPPRSFRVVTLFHVLEHVPDPLALLGSIRDIQEEGGLLVLEVPDHGGLAFRILKGRHFCFDHPRHRFFLSSASLKSLLRATGFTPVGEDHFSLQYSVFTALQNALNLLPGRPNRLYDSLRRNAEGSRLRRSPLTWLHLLLGVLLLPAATVFSATGLVLPRGNTLTMYARKGRERL